MVRCASAYGATTFALALATAANTDARVVECSSATTSGLAAASTAELGAHPSGWVQGSRGEVLLQRTERRAGQRARRPIANAGGEERR